MRPTGKAPVPGQYPVRFGLAELLADADWPNGWLLSVDGVAQSYVDLDDPTNLEFDYVRRIGDVIDCLGEPGAALDVVHVGGGACTVPRYLAATRPGSRQLVFDLDGELIDLVREHLRLREVPQLRVRICDGREGMATRRDGTADLVVLDAFQRASMPGGLATREFLADVHRVLRDHGTLVVNVTDGPGLRFARRVLATLGQLFPHGVLVGEPAVLRNRRFGNLVLVAAKTELPVAEITSRVHSAAFPARCVAGEELAKLRGSAEPLTDEAPMVAPVPPSRVFGA